MLELDSLPFNTDKSNVKPVREGSVNTKTKTTFAALSTSRKVLSIQAQLAEKVLPLLQPKPHLQHHQHYGKCYIFYILQYIKYNIIYCGNFNLFTSGPVRGRPHKSGLGILASTRKYLQRDNRSMFPTSKQIKRMSKCVR